MHKHSLMDSLKSKQAGKETTIREMGGGGDIKLMDYFRAAKKVCQWKKQKPNTEEQNAETAFSQTALSPLLKIIKVAQQLFSWR